MAQNVIINGVTYSSVPEVDMPTTDGGTAQFFDTSTATMTDGSQMLSPYKAWSRGVLHTGTIPTKTDADLTASGDTVTVPKGYYASQATKSVGAGSATTPATSITANPSISVSASGLITASVSASQSVTPTVEAGYVDRGTAGTVSVSGSKTQQLTTQGATTITPTTTNQTVPAGTYLTGVLTVEGDSDLVSGNILANHSIFGVDGSVTLPTISQDATTKVLSIS